MNDITMTIVSPLEWPARVPRADERVRGKFGTRRGERGGLQRMTFERARDLLLNELIRFGAVEAVVRSNFPMRKDGWIRLANRKEPDDPGVAVYFNLEGTRQVIAIDRYDAGGDNLYAVARTIEALRQIERDGGPTIRAAAVSGFRELPASTSGVNWWEVLGVETDASIEEIRRSYRRLAKRYHPDNKMTSDAVRFSELAIALQQGNDARGGTSS